MKALKILFITLCCLIVTAAVSVAALGAYNIVRAPEFFLNSETVAALPDLDEGFTPYGLCEVPDGMLVSGNAADGEGRIYLLRKNGEVGYTTLLDESFDVFCQPARDVYFFDEFVYLASGSAVYVYYYEDFALGLKEAEYYEIFETVGGADWCTVSDGLLYVGSCHSEESCTGEWQHLTLPSGETNYSLITVFRVNESTRYGIIPQPICIISAPADIHGMAVSYEGIVLSVGDGNGSRLEFHTLNDYNYDYVTVIRDGEETEMMLYILSSATLRQSIAAPSDTLTLHYTDGTLYTLSGSDNEFFFIRDIKGGGKIWSIPLKKDHFIKKEA